MKPNPDDPCAECGMAYRDHDPEDFVAIDADPTIYRASIGQAGAVLVPAADLAALRAVAAAVSAALPHLLIFNEEREKMATLKEAVAALRSGDGAAAGEDG